MGRAARSKEKNTSFGERSWWEKGCESLSSLSSGICGGRPGLEKARGLGCLRKPSPHLSSAISAPTRVTVYLQVAPSDCQSLLLTHMACRQWP